MARKKKPEPFRVKDAPPGSPGIEWKCFECGKVEHVPALLLTRDGASWGNAPAGWLFVQDGEPTYLCSRACLEAIYARDD